MAGRISRRILTDYVAERLLAGDSIVVQQLAAHLIESRRTKEVDLYVYDIETALLDKGVVIADVTSARDLADTTKRAITEYLRQSYNARSIELRQAVDESVVGGVKIQTADAEYDATLQRKLTKLQKMKV